MGDHAKPGRPLGAGLALIFDMDGVIVDSNPVHRLAWEALARRFGLETTEAMMRQHMYGKRNDEIIRGFFGDGLPPQEIAARSDAKEEIYRALVAGRVEGLLVPGLKEFLKFHRGAPMGLASNAGRENIDWVLDGSGLREFFQVVVDGHQVSKPKPHPEIYLRVSEALGVPPGNCIVFEDSYFGVEAGLSAGMRIVGLRTTHGDLPGTSITIDNFLSGSLCEWLSVQNRVV